MFRRLAESFTDGGTAAPPADHGAYLESQERYFNTVDHLIPSGIKGLPGFSTAIQSADTVGSRLQPPVVAYPDDVFRPVVSQDLKDQAAQCETASVDELIAMKKTSMRPDEMGCGWLYTPPVNGSPYPQLSKGFLGTEQGPLTGLSPPEYKKWFFDLQLAKKQALMDKCKALKACTDVDSDVFKGSCGFCTTINQGVPLDAVGKPLIMGNGVAQCSDDAIVTSAAKCPPPPSAGDGPQTRVDRTCEPVNGRLSADCLYRMVMTGGCKDNGSLAVALAGSDPNRDVLSLRNSDTVKVYNRVANPPLRMEIFQQGNATADQVLQEVRQLASSSTSSIDTSAIGAAARDLCIRKGAFDKYDMCLELTDGQAGPFDLQCLQRLFLSMGGQPTGSAYPSAGTKSYYDSLGNWGAVKQRMQALAANMNSSDYTSQRNAMIQFLGITPEKSIQRAPYVQGIEVFWFVPVYGNPNRVAGFLKRTIERDIVQLQAGPSRVAQIGGGAFGCMVQLMDIRAPADFSAKFAVTVDDGFWIAVNQPAAIDKQAMNQNYADRPGLFENLGLQGPTRYASQSCSTFKAATPNVTKLYFEDAGGGWNAFQFAATACAGTSAFQAPYYSLTCEPKAPFLTYEVGLVSGLFEETRNPGLFGQFLGLQGLEYHVRPEERESVPGRKGFVRINNASSLIDMYNIAYQSWRTMTCAFRLKTMPVRDTLLKLAFGQGYVSVIATPSGGSSVALSIDSVMAGSSTNTYNSFSVNLNVWYMLGVHSYGDRFTVFCAPIDQMAQNGYAKGVTLTSLSKSFSGRMFRENGTWAPAPGQPSEACTVMMGSKGFVGRSDWPGMYATSAFQYDLAWIHFFQQMADQETMKREALANWVYTTFPSADGVYQTTGAV